MTQVGGVQSWCLGVTLPLVLAAALFQGFATVASPTAAPHQDPGKPERGNYQVNGTNGTACLLASMALQLNVTYISQTKPIQDVFNIQPNLTKSSGSCDSDTAILQLLSDGEKINLTFIFTLNTTSSKYHLGEVFLTAVLTDVKGTPYTFTHYFDVDPFSVRNASLDYLRGTLGYSYRCRNEETLSVAQNLSINTFLLQVQPFGVNGKQFSTAEECQLDEDDMLIPIVVGAALAGLVVIVLVAYLIGRKRSHAGYQTI